MNVYGDVVTDEMSKAYSKVVALALNGTEPARTLRVHQAQLLIAAGNPEAEAPPAWRPLSP